MIKKRDCIIQKTKSRYWTRTRKFGIIIPKYIKEKKDIYKSNRNTNWWYEILKEMKNVKVSFELFDVKEHPVRLIKY